MDSRMSHPSSLLPPAESPDETRETLTSGRRRPLPAQSNGEHLNAHGGGVIRVNGTFYLIGEVRIPCAVEYPFRLVSGGIST